MLTEEEFCDWFDKNNGTDEAYGAAWHTYQTFFGAAGIRDETKDIERFKEVYEAVYGKPPHLDFNKRWVEIVDNPDAMHSQEAWLMFAQGVNHGSNINI